MDPESVLKSRSSVCDGYARLLVGMLTEAGLRAHKVCGCGKGRDWDQVEDGKGPTDSNHAWVAVQIQGLVPDPGVIEPSNAPAKPAARPQTASARPQTASRRSAGQASWCLIDPCWTASRAAVRGKTEGGNIVYEKRFADEYFLTRPEFFVLDHLPDEKAWQLLPPANVMSPTSFLLTHGDASSGWRATSHPLNVISISAELFKRQGLRICFQMCKPLTSYAKALKFKLFQAFAGPGGFQSVGGLLASVTGTGASEGGPSSPFSLDVRHLGMPPNGVEFSVSGSLAAEVSPGSVFHLEIELGVDKVVGDDSGYYTRSEATYTLHIN